MKNIFFRKSLRFSDESLGDSLKESLIIKTFDDIKIKEHPQIYLIKNIMHAIIVFPEGLIFNCNPENYPLPIEKKMLDGIIVEQVEPSLEIYEDYWNTYSMIDNMLENDQNCVLWCGYYLWWYLNKETKTFPCTLKDLELWCKNYIT